MREKDTVDLTEVLRKTRLSEFRKYCNENKDSMNLAADSFYIYMKELLARRGLTQQTVFLRADVPERYGYKLLSGEKHTRQRDVILRICYAAEMTLGETQRALKKYEMPALYAKNPRDALLMLLFQERPGSLIEVNAALRENGMEPLKASGLQE